MKKKIIAYIIGILGCIIIDAGLVAMVVAFGASRPFYDYIFLVYQRFLLIFCFLPLLVYALRSQKINAW